LLPYQLDATQTEDYATALYNYRWVSQTDPFGVVHDIIDYPGVPVDPDSVDKNYEVLEGVKIPIRSHFGVMGPVATDFGVTQIVDGNWGVHGIIQKDLLPGA
jgi:acetamidase/formamidase